MKPAPDVPLDDVIWRVDSEPYDRDGRTVCRFVPYIDSRIAARLLDEWVGPERWRDEYEPTTLNGKEALFCHLSVRADDGEWLTKVDVGVAPNNEAQKGIVSDAFKRVASIKWGAGRNVYDLPTLWAPCDTYGSAGKRKARANNETKPSLMRQLERRGITADVKTEDDDEHDEPVETIGKYQQAELLSKLSAVGRYPDGWMKARLPKRAEIATLPVARLAEATAILDDALDELGRRAEQDVAGGEDASGVGLVPSDESHPDYAGDDTPGGAHTPDGVDGSPAVEQASPAPSRTRKAAK